MLAVFSHLVSSNIGLSAVRLLDPKVRNLQYVSNIQTINYPYNCQKYSKIYIANDKRDILLEIFYL